MVSIALPSNGILGTVTAASSETFGDARSGTLGHPQANPYPSSGAADETRPSPHSGINWSDQQRELIRQRYRGDVARDAADLPADPIIVVTNPDEDCSPEAFRSFIDDLLAGPEPELDTIGAAEALSELRADSGA
ncbi:MAG: hypothetical protein M3357_13130 [Actinomycetota bacterium]|nr:hypothetical protein [Actinomycetota bacterium]